MRYIIDDKGVDHFLIEDGDHNLIEDDIEYVITVYSDGIDYFNADDALHREIGPARIYKINADDYDNPKQYWLNGKYYPKVNSADEMIIASIIE